MIGKKCAIVTGGGGGIGTAAVAALVREHIAVCLVDRNDCADRVEALKQAGHEAMGIACDVTDMAQITAARVKVLEEWGRIDILVNAAGIGGYGSVEDMREEDWDHVLEINLKGTFLFSQAVIAAMRERNWGRIINIGSVVGKNGGNARPWLDPSEQARMGSAAYGASKAAVHAFTWFLAKELASANITVNAIAPGPIETELLKGKFPKEASRLIPAGRFGRPSEVGHAVAYLIAEEAAFVTGEIMDVNGGIWMD